MLLIYSNLCLIFMKKYRNYGANITKGFFAMNISFINDEYSNNLNDALAFARKHQLKYIELRNINGKNITDLTSNEALDYSTQIAQSGILVSAVNTPFLYWQHGECNFNISGQRADSEEEYFTKLMDIADIFGAQYISIYSYLNNHMDIDTLGKQLDIYSQKALERGIVLLLNIDKNCNIANINKIHQLFENYNFSNIYPLINTGKIIAENDNYNPQELQDIINTCNYFHLSDYDDELKRYVVLGEGHLDLDMILQDKKADNNAFVSLYPATGHPEDLTMSLNQLQAWED